MKKRIRAVPGGTSAGKTIAILSILISLAQSDKTHTITSVVSESFPHLRTGAIRDFLRIMKEHNYFDKSRWNKTDSTYTFESGSIIEFFSVDTPGKVHGPRRHRLFVNEANHVLYETFTQLLIRTEEFVYLDWNPTSGDFWYFTELQGKRDDVEEVVVTYKDNEALSRAIVSEIESRKHQKNWWRVYGEGMPGILEGRVIKKDWQIIKEIPYEARLVSRGLDFGYAKHPSVLVDIYYLNGGYIFDEVFYRKGMDNTNIAQRIMALEDQDVVTVADSSEPKSIKEIEDFGVYIIAAQKGADSRRNGADKLNRLQISVTEKSVNIIRENRNLQYRQKRDGTWTNEPEDINDHCFDAIRYALEQISIYNSYDDDEEIYSEHDKELMERLSNHD